MQSEEAGELEFDPIRLRYRRKPRTPDIKIVSSRGTKLTSLFEARRRQRDVLAPGDPGVQWGSLRVPSEPMPHFSLFGVTRSGKTSVLRLIAQDLLPNVGSDTARPARALVYDPKRDLTRFIVGLHQNPSLVVFTNPLDKRSAAWDLAKDFDRPTYAQELANLLVPPESSESHHNFYPRVVRLMLRAIIQSFISTVPGKWTLRDVIFATRDQDDLKEILSRTADTRDALEELTQNEETFGNLRISVYEKLSDLHILAALWHHAGSHKFSVRDWMENPKTLLLTQNPDQRSLMLRVNTLLFNRACQMLLSQEDDTRVASYLFLDELARAERLEELSHVLAEGQSRRISAILASQGIELLQQVYGEKVCEDILSHCRNKAFLSLARKTAEWAADVVGYQEDMELHESVGSGPDTSRPQNNRSLQRHKHHAVMPEEFMVDLVRFEPGSPLRNVPLRGVFQSDPGFGTVQDEIRADILFEQMLRKTPDVPSSELRHPGHQKLPRWSQTEREQLGLKPRELFESETPEDPPLLDPFETFKEYRFEDDE